MGFQEIPHTADWALRVWGEDLPALLSESARGMNWLAGVLLDKDNRIQRVIECAGTDPESLLVAFLSELVYHTEHDHLGFDQFEFQRKSDRLKVTMTGAPLQAYSKR